jgi:glycogen(starch) synthase
MTAASRGRVLMTTDAVGGVWNYAVDLAEGLACHGMEVTLAVLGPDPSAAQRRAVDAMDGVELVETGQALDWLAEDELEVARTARAVADLASSRRVDLVHLNSPSLAAQARFPAPAVGACHSCLATWWEAVRGADMPNDFRWRTEQLARGYGACAELIAPSFAFAQDTLAQYGRLPRVVRNGRDGRGRHPGSTTSPVVLTSGRLWDEAKNLATLDRAAARMWGPVQAAGPLSGPNGQSIGTEAVTPLGKLDAAELDKRLNQAAVFASLALYEPFGLGVLEAAQAGCALVLADIPTFRELWQGAAVFVPAREAEAAATLLDALLSDPRACLRMGALAAARAAQFTSAAMVEGTLATYRQAGLAVREAAA